MAEVIHLPTTSDLAGTERQIALLTRAIEEGAELGSRARHIDMLSCDLERLLEMLRQKLAWFEARSAVTETQRRKLASFVQAVEGVIATTQSLKDEKPPLRQESSG